MLWIDDLDTWAVTHEHREHFNIDHDLNLEDTAAVLFIHLQKYLRRMDRLRAYISALLARRPEPYLPRGIPYILAHSNYIVKEVLGIEIWILPERDVGRFNAYNCALVDLFRIFFKVVKISVAFPYPDS